MLSDDRGLLVQRLTRRHGALKKEKDGQSISSGIEIALLTAATCSWNRATDSVQTHPRLPSSVAGQCSCHTRCLLSKHWGSMLWIKRIQKSLSIDVNNSSFLHQSMTPPGRPLWAFRLQSNFPLQWLTFGIDLIHVISSCCLPSLNHHTYKSRPSSQGCTFLSKFRHSSMASQK